MEINTLEDLEAFESYILVRDSTGTVYERIEGNKFWWTIGSLSARKTNEIELPAVILIKE